MKWNVNRKGIVKGEPGHVIRYSEMVDMCAGHFGVWECKGVEDVWMVLKTSKVHKCKNMQKCESMRVEWVHTHHQSPLSTCWPSCCCCHTLTSMWSGLVVMVKPPRAFTTHQCGEAAGMATFQDSLSCSQWQKNKHHKLYLTHKEWINPFFKCFFSSLIKSLGQQMSFLRWLTNLAYWDISFRLRFWSVVSLQLYETLKIYIAGEDKVIRLFVVWITNTIMCHHIWELGHQVMQPWDQPLFFGGVLSNTKVFAVLHNFWLTTFSNPSDF